MFSLFMFELFALLVLFYSAEAEYKIILNNIGKPFDKLSKTSNAELVYASIQAIFKNRLGEFQAFLYPIMLICIALLSYFQIKAIGYSEVSKWLIVYLGAVCFIVLLHIVIPYYFTYLKYYELALNKKMNFLKFLDYSTNNFYKSENIENIKLDDYNLGVVREAFNLEFTLDNYEEYNKIFDIISTLNERYRKLSIDEYEKVLAHLNGKNIYFKEIETDKFCEFWLESDKEEIEVNRVIVGPTQMGMALFRKTTIYSLLNQRYLDIASFFFLLNLILYFTS